MSDELETHGRWLGGDSRWEQMKGRVELGLCCFFVFNNAYHGCNELYHCMCCVRLLAVHVKLLGYERACPDYS